MCIRDRYGNHVLQSLKDGKITGKALDIEMNLIADKGFMLSDFLDSKK